MDKKLTFLTVIIVFVITNLLQADNSSIWEQETVTNGFWGLNDQLADYGVEMGFSITSIYQANVKGGTSTHNRRGRHSGSYDLEAAADLHKLLGFESGSIYLLVEGGWPDAEGIDTVSVGSAFGVNADTIGNDNMLVKEFYYTGSVFSNSLGLMIGKIDFTGVFDTSEYADDERSQFLNYAFVNNPTIPFPQYSLGAVLTWDITDLWYLMGGIADAQADGRETGFRTTFYKQDYFFYALETGITQTLTSDNGPMPGTYRIGLWNDPQPKANSDRSDAGKRDSDDTGFYASCDQMLYKESSDSEDSQGLGAFFRYGYAPSRNNDITNYWSVGFQYQGLFDGRDEDILALGFAQAFFSNSADSTYPEDHESVLEMYYNAKVTPWINVSPGIQYIANPGGVRTAKDVVVLGLRARVIF